MAERGSFPVDVAIEALTMDAAAVKQQVERLPEEARRMLTFGPIIGQEGCRVCDALLRLKDSSDAARRLLAFHANMADAEAEYARCVMVYRAAGYKGY